MNARIRAAREALQAGPWLEPVSGRTLAGAQAAYPETFSPEFLRGLHECCYRYFGPGLEPAAYCGYTL